MTVGLARMIFSSKAGIRIADRFFLVSYGALLVDSTTTAQSLNALSPGALSSFSEKVLAALQLVGGAPGGGSALGAAALASSAGTYSSVDTSFITLDFVQRGLAHWVTLVCSANHQKQLSGFLKTFSLLLVTPPFQRALQGVGDDDAVIWAALTGCAAFRGILVTATTFPDLAKASAIAAVKAR